MCRPQRPTGRHQSSSSATIGTHGSGCSMSSDDTVSSSYEETRSQPFFEMPWHRRRFPAGRRAVLERRRRSPRPSLKESGFHLSSRHSLCSCWHSSPPPSTTPAELVPADLVRLFRTCRNVGCRLMACDLVARSSLCAAMMRAHAVMHSRSRESPSPVGRTTLVLCSGVKPTSDVVCRGFIAEV